MKKKEPDQKIANSQALLQVGQKGQKHETKTKNVLVILIVDTTKDLKTTTTIILHILEHALIGDVKEIFHFL